MGDVGLLPLARLLHGLEQYLVQGSERETLDEVVTHHLKPLPVLGDHRKPNYYGPCNLATHRAWTAWKEPRASATPARKRTSLTLEPAPDYG